jgi:methyl-accepting chemotaxis protein
MNIYNKFTVGQRLAFGFGLSSLLLVLVVGSSWWVLNSVNQDVDQIVNKNNLKTNITWHMRAELEATARSVRNLIVTRDSGVQAKQKSQQIESRQRFDTLYNSLEPLMIDAQEQALHTEIGQLRDVVLPLLDEAIAQASRGMKETASETLIEKVEGPQVHWIATMQSLIDLQSKRTATRVQAMNQNLSTATIGLLGGMFTAAIISLGLGLGIGRTLLRQLGGEPTYARDVARRIAAGDLAESITLHHGDTESLLCAMQEMQQGLRTMVIGIKASADSVSLASDEIAQGNFDLSHRTEQQSSNLQATSSSMGQLTQTVRKNTSSAREANTLATAATEVASAGGQAVNEVIQRMTQIQDASRNIADITGVIDSIAFQTNILALNAAVEAARAGEQGRGFAVVASEVRNLAQRSAQAAKEIKTLISDNVERVDDGSRLVVQAGQTMSDIVARVRQVSTIVAEITSASIAQESGIAQIETAINGLDSTTQQNAALVEQSSAAADSLKSQAALLIETVSLFQLQVSPASPRPLNKIEVLPTPLVSAQLRDYS